MAAANGYIVIVKELLLFKSDGKIVVNINARNSEGNTSLRKF